MNFMPFMHVALGLDRALVGDQHTSIVDLRGRGLQVRTNNR